VIFRFLAVATLAVAPLGAADARRIALEGTWGFQLDGANAGHTEGRYDRGLEANAIFLPGSTDQGGYGARVTTPDKGWLTRPYKYEGPAWNQKQVVIPGAWRGQRVTLLLERPHYQTEVWVGSKPVGSQDSLSTPHEYDLTTALEPGSHWITICVDHTYRIEVGRDAHSITEHTQTNWNGIAGRIEPRASPPVWVDDVAIHPDIAAMPLRATGAIRGLGGAATAGEPTASVPGMAQAVASARLSRTFNLTVPVAEAKLWDEYDGVLYTLVLRLGADTVGTPFGMRRMATRSTQFVLNGRPIFLRGTRSNGLNAFRFQSYCPPEAAFRAWDGGGFLLHVELPVWSRAAGKDPALNDYMSAKGHRILKHYRNHPSFSVLCLGNELSGDDVFLDGLVAEFKASDPRRLNTCSADHRLRVSGPASDYYVTQQTSTGRLRVNGTGFGQIQDGTDHDSTASVKAVPVPLVAHKLGHWAVYPNFDESAKYTGVLQARNLDVFRDQVAARGMIVQTRDSLLQLQDFPGQGETVPLVRMRKFVWKAGETFEARAEVAHYVLNDTLPESRPIVQVIDDFHRNYKLGTVFEAMVGQGRLLVASYDLSAKLEQRPVARQLFHSLLADAADFAPKARRTAQDFETIVGPK